MPLSNQGPRGRFTWKTWKSQPTGPLPTPPYLTVNRGSGPCGIQRCPPGHTQCPPALGVSKAYIQGPLSSAVGGQQVRGPAGAARGLSAPGTKCHAQEGGSEPQRVTNSRPCVPRVSLRFVWFGEQRGSVWGRREGRGRVGEGRPGPRLVCFLPSFKTRFSN